MNPTRSMELSELDYERNQREREALGREYDISSNTQTLRNMLNGAIEDEGTAGSDYDRMSELADESNMPKVSALLKMIAEQERTHDTALRKLRDVL